MTREEAIREAIMDNMGIGVDATVEAVLAALDSLEALVQCSQCQGTGEQTLWVSDPDCGNCQHGDCDYGHAKEIPCFRCKSTGRVQA